MAEKEENEWVAVVDKWNVEVAKAVAKPVRARAVPLLPWRGNWPTACNGCCVGWEDLEVVGPTATWVREILQNTYSTDYLRKQSAGLFRSQVGPL
jgi:hypothetical protein